MVARRTFLLAGTGAMVAYAVPPFDQVTLGVIGSGGRGTFVMGTFQKDPALRVAAICDVYEPNLENAVSVASKVPGTHPRQYRNYKELLADKDVQAVLIATPEHWHYQMVLDALAAGKDVYVEKPLCQTPEQGVALVEAEKKTRSIIQVGMQRRSFDLYLEGRKIVAAGQLGSVRMARSWWLNNYLGGSPATRLDGKLDWEQWQGPAEHRPFDANRFRQWRFYSDYAGGILADQGAHVFDGIHMLMGAGYPAAVTAAAGKPHKAGVDQPESVVATAEYSEDFIGVFSINYAAMQYKSRNDQLNQLDGDKARMDIGREDLKVYLKGAEDAPAVEKKSEKGFGWATDLHVQNFLECVRTRKTPTAPMRIAFQAALVVQMANLSLRNGRRMRWDAAAQRVV
ncbi:MAG TPA: Gfo/Idh/MocA family oxidoreductase [Candidatus Acidoferrales bacterium]|nr:Gfo/Idh/MocA family oxidoreductase [Candidatus Acidoferrales bacterium]